MSKRTISEGSDELPPIASPTVKRSRSTRGALDNLAHQVQVSSLIGTILHDRFEQLECRMTHNLPGTCKWCAIKID